MAIAYSIFLCYASAMTANWNVDRAIGFVIGIGSAFFFASGLITEKPLPFGLAIATVALGVLVPTHRHRAPR